MEGGLGGASCSSLETWPSGSDRNRDRCLAAGRRAHRSAVELTPLPVPIPGSREIVSGALLQERGNSRNPTGSR